MTRHLAIMLAAAAVAFGLILVAKRLVTHPDPGPWLTDEDAAFARAAEQHAAVLVDFHAGWSVPSNRMSSALDGLAPMIDHDYVRLRIDISDGTREELRERYGIATVPAILLLRADGRELGRITQVLDRPALRDAIQDAVR